MKINDEQIEWFKEAEKTIKKGYYPNGEKAIESYKAIFSEEINDGKMRSNLNPKCGGCIREAVINTMKKIRELEQRINDKQGVKKED